MLLWRSSSSSYIVVSFSSCFSSSRLAGFLSFFFSSLTPSIPHSFSTLKQREPCQRCLPSLSAATCSLGFSIQTPALSPASQTCRGFNSSLAQRRRVKQRHSEKACYLLNRIISITLKWCKKEK